MTSQVPELKKLLAVLGVVRLAEAAACGQKLAGADREGARLDAAENLADEPTPHGVGLDQDECRLHGHRRGTVTTPRGGDDGTRSAAM